MDTIGVPPKVRQQSRHVASRRCLTSSAHPVPKVTFTSILLAVPLSTTPGKLSYHVPCDERLAGDSSHPPLPSLRLGRSFVFQPAAGLRQEELQIPVPWRNQPQRYGREKKLSSTPSAFPAGLAGVDKENHLNQTSQKERSGQHAVVKPELFLWGGRVST